MEIDESEATPAINDLVDRVRQSGRTLMVRRAGKTIAVLTPASNKQTGRRKPARSLRDDPIWNLIGLAADIDKVDAPRDVSENKHHYLAEAYFADHFHGLEPPPTALSADSLIGT